MSKNLLVSAKGLGKEYWLYSTNARRVLGCFFNPKRVGARSIKALSGLTFELYAGEALALIGKNGAGKSTALQLLAGIIKPTEGQYSVTGRICALLELGSGFNPEFTGRQNIYLAGLLAGLTREEVNASEQSIVEFSEIGHYIDQPVKFYSSGMFLRLAFAVALSGRPDILIVDEALAVGDIFFRQKCYDKLRKLREQGMAVLLVTHNMGDVTEFCDRAILLENGSTKYFSDCKDAVLAYYAMEYTKEVIPPANVDTHECVAIDSDDTNLAWVGRDDVIHPPLEKQVSLSGAGHIKNILLTDETGKARGVFSQGEMLRILVEYKIQKKIATPVAGYVIWNNKGIPVCGKNFLHDGLDLPSSLNAGESLFSKHDVWLNLECGEYSLNLGLVQLQENISKTKMKINSTNEIGSRVVDMQNCVMFSVVPNSKTSLISMTHHGIANLPGAQSYCVVKN